MSLKEIKALQERCLSGTATPDEQAIFENYKDQFDLLNIPWTTEMGDREEVKNKLRKDLELKLNRQRVVPLRRIYWSAAASILIVVGVAWLTWQEKGLPKHVPQISRVQPIIKPAENKAILILGDSQSIALDSSELGQLATQGNTAIIKNRKKQLQYLPNISSRNSKPEFNTLVTPRGGQYELQLADGTKVWLNADSRLRFPVNFTGRERVIELTGEAYFEVAKNKNSPFKVITGSKTVEVLGTHFNVSAYPNEIYRTTLLEGSVRLNASNGASAILRPSEQGVFNSQSRFSTAKADTAAIVAWKNGVFLFRNENIKNIMQQISRWYDVDVYYKGDLSNVKLGGTVSRYSNITKLLNTMEFTGSVHFKIEGRRVIVMK